jgi:hypothetical protein
MPNGATLRHAGAHPQPTTAEKSDHARMWKTVVLMIAEIAPVAGAMMVTFLVIMLVLPLVSIQWIPRSNEQHCQRV